MSKISSIEFSEENIRKIFGSYDGEGENIERLKEYYMKTDTYRQVMADLPVRILVGTKGIGKSALLRVAMAEQKELGYLPILIRPDDIGEIGEKHESLILSIKKWKFGLTDIIAKKVLNEFGLSDDSVTSKIIKVGGKVMSLIAETVSRDKLNLQPAQQMLIEKFLKSNRIIVYLDDLDRGWQNRKEGLIMISALINSIRDMSNENPELSFKLALRSDVYSAVRTADESSDKYDGSVIYHSYELHEIFVMLVKRVTTFFNVSVDEQHLLKTEQRHMAHYLDPIMEHTFQGKGLWNDAPMYRVLMSLIRNRPRDLVKLCTLAARNAHKDNSKVIKTKHIEAILPDYSKSIINDTVAEYKSELPDIERLIYGMKAVKRDAPTSESFSYTTAELHNKLFNIMQLGKFSFASDQPSNERHLKEFLYKINFITAKKKLEDGTNIWKNYDQDNHLASPYKDYGYDWEVHMSYRWVLQADTLDDIFARIGIR